MQWSKVRRRTIKLHAIKCTIMFQNYISGSMPMISTLCCHLVKSPCFLGSCELLMSGRQRSWLRHYPTTWPRHCKAWNLWTRSLESIGRTTRGDVYGVGYVITLYRLFFLIRKCGFDGVDILFEVNISKLDRIICVGALEHFLFFYILGIIIPTD